MFLRSVQLINILYHFGRCIEAILPENFFCNRRTLKIMKIWRFNPSLRVPRNADIFSPMLSIVITTLYTLNNRLGVTRNFLNFNFFFKFRCVLTMQISASFQYCIKDIFSHIPCVYDFSMRVIKKKRFLPKQTLSSYKFFFSTVSPRLDVLANLCYHRRM